MYCVTIGKDNFTSQVSSKYRNIFKCYCDVPYCMCVVLFSAIKVTVFTVKGKISPNVNIGTSSQYGMQVLGMPNNISSMQPNYPTMPNSMMPTSSQGHGQGFYGGPNMPFGENKVTD
jgi:hypothetical protein